MKLFSKISNLIRIVLRFLVIAKTAFIIFVFLNKLFLELKKDKNKNKIDEI